MDYEFESIIPWNGEHDTGRDARQKLDRNFAKIKANFQELAGTTFVTTAFFARIFGIDGEDGAQVDINDMEAVITAVKVKFGLYSESFVSAKGLNPESGSEPGGATTLAALTDVSITTTPKDGQVLAYDITIKKWKPVDMEATAGIDEAQLAQYLTTNNYAKKADITAALTDYALKTTRITAGTGLAGGGTLAQNVTLSLAAVGTAGTYTKVTVDAYGRVTGHASLTQGDIPALAISKITGLQTALDAKLNKSVFEELFEKVWVSGYGYAIRAKLAFYSEGWISTKGLNSDAGSTTGGVDKDEVLQIVENAGYIKSSALNGYATQSWVNSQGFVKDAFIPRGQVLNTSVDNMGEIGAYIVNENSGLPSGAYEWGTLMTFNSLASGSYGVQMYVEDGADTKTYLRARYGGSWQSWRMLVETHNIGNYALTPSNYTNYTVTKTGSGASGTWGIGISGNAATATRLQTARTLWGQNFAGTSDVSGNLSEVGNVSLISNYTYDCGSYGIQWNNVYSRAFYMGQVRGTNYISEGNGDNATYTAYNMKIHAHWGIGITDTEDVCRIVIDSRAGSITMRGYLQIGSARLIYDSTNNALYVQKSDGSQCGFYATGFVSAKGGNSSSGSAVAGVTELSKLHDVIINSPSNGQALVYRNGTWKNETIETGLKSVAWADVTGTPTTLAGYGITDAITYETAEARYIRKNLGTIGNGTDLNDYGASGLYFVSASDYTSIANFPEKSQYGYGILANLMNADKVGIQWYVPDNNHNIAVRMSWNGTRWNDWNYFLTNKNYTGYTVTRTGGGASGTWGIGISGNAASATKLQTARAIWGKSFDGTANVSGDLRNVGSIIPLSGSYDLGTSSNYWNYIWAYRLSLIDNGTNYICSGNGDNATYNTYNIKVHSHWGIGITDNEDICRLVIDARTGSITMRGALSVGSYVQIGSARLYYDSGNNALYVQKSDGSQCGFYATGFVSAKGGNSSSGSAVAGVTELSKLHDVIINSPTNGQALVYRNGVWKNETIQTGGGSASVAWSDITGKPTWIGSSKPSYSFSEITGTPSVTISSSNATNLSINVEGARKTISNLYAEYLGGTTKAGLFTGLTYSGNKLSVTIGGTTKSVTINAGSSGSYLPLSGGTVTGNLVVDTGSGTKIRFDSDIRVSMRTNAGWSRGFSVFNSTFTSIIMTIAGAYGGVNSLTYLYYGGTFESPGMVILPNKNVGIGTTSPSYKLHVVGSAYATGGFQNGSDIRYKHVLSALPLTVAQVAAAPSFLFRWTDGTADGVQAGTSAQYWQQVMPQVVTESAGRLSMQYDKAALAAAIATARTVVDHEQRIRKLEQQLLNAV